MVVLVGMGERMAERFVDEGYADNITIDISKHLHACASQVQIIFNYTMTGDRFACFIFEGLHRHGCKKQQQQ